MPRISPGWTPVNALFCFSRRSTQPMSHSQCCTAGRRLLTSLSTNGLSGLPDLAVRLGASPPDLTCFDCDCQTSVYFALEHEIALVCCRQACGVCSDLGKACHPRHSPLNFHGRTRHGLFSGHRQKVFGLCCFWASVAFPHLRQVLPMVPPARRRQPPPLL